MVRGCCDLTLLLFSVTYSFDVVNLYPTYFTNTCQCNLIYFFNYFHLIHGC